MGPLSRKAKISKQTLSYTLKRGRLVPWVQPATRMPEIMMVVRHTATYTTTDQFIRRLALVCIRRQMRRRLHTQASEMAKPFFEKHGWILLKTQKITRENIELTNHKMEKHLS